jgi:glycogen phosphorylase
MFENKEKFCQEFQDEVLKTYGRSIDEAHLDEIYEVLGKMVREYASVNWKKAKDESNKLGKRQLIYFSMEFLLGRMLKNNLENLGIYDLVVAGFKDMNIDFKAVTDLETDAGLGNGGLGRLAACYMDSLASLGYLGNGNCIRYEYGFFKQKIDENGCQVEIPDQWLKLGNAWEVRKPYRTIDVAFYGRVETEWKDGRNYYHLVDAEHINAVPYDVPMIGYHNGQVNTLRLWSAEPSSQQVPPDQDFYDYLSSVRRLCHGLYPDDSTESGKILRLKQQYFFVSAGIQSTIQLYMKMGHKNLDDFAKHTVFQLNDTHPVLGIPEMMRILLDEYGYEWDDAWKIVENTFAYTNHTIMQEALEKWPVHYIEQLLPRIYTIIQEINRRFTNYVREKFEDESLVSATSIIRDDLVHMTHLAIVGSFSINGVAKLHSEILKTEVLAPFYKVFPEKFRNVTNGVTQRRFLAYANPELKQLLDKTIGPSWLGTPSDLAKLLEHVDEPSVQQEFLKVKQTRKQILADYILEHNGIKVDVNSIFDVQVKRLHAYKRQLLNVLHIIALYQYMLEHKDYKIVPRTFIFGAKAAPSYEFAKKVIELINCVAKVINNDSRINNQLKVVFIENYDVSKAEIIVPACDVSVQISTAGKEASGTGNMKCMMNGSLTFGTYDGANVEISELVGPDNCLIFGLREAKIRNLRRSGTYSATNIYLKDPIIKKAIDALVDGTFDEDEKRFISLYNEILLKNDEYFILADFEAYARAFMQIDSKYLDKTYWAKMCLVNIAKSGYFSSDRAVQDYVDTIWHLEKVK